MLSRKANSRSVCSCPDSWPDAAGSGVSDVAFNGAQDPGGEVGHPGVDVRRGVLGAAGAEGRQAHQVPAAVCQLAGHGPSGVALQGRNVKS